MALSADNWNSLERYLLNAFPVFWALGVVTARREVERWCWRWVRRGCWG